MTRPDKNLKKELMLGLIYPAVLGSIFYTALGKLGEQFSFAWLSLSGGGFDWSALTAVKLFLLLVAIAFYFCDFLYIRFTRDYRTRFFVYDLIFVATMYAAFAAIGLENRAQPPDAELMLSLYFVFMFLYHRWDMLELKGCEPGEERELFRKVVRWERVSMLAIAGCLLLIVGLERAWPSMMAGASWVPGFLVALVMTTITVFFALYTRDKGRLASRPQQIVV